jgi:hypothetical protein
MLAPHAHPLMLSARDPEVAIALERRATRAARDCHALLETPSPAAAKLSGLQSILAEQCDMNMTGPGWPAIVLGFLLTYRPGPFTWVLQRLTGKVPRVEPIDPSGATRMLTGPEALALAVRDPAEHYLWERRGLMLLGTTVAAEVSLRVVPTRIGGWEGEEMALIRKGIPCGQVIRDLTRAVQQAETHWPAAPAVTGSAVLRDAAAIPFGFAGEQVTKDLIQWFTGV